MAFQLTNKLFLSGFLILCCLLISLPASGSEDHEHPYRYICGCAMATGCQLSYDHPGTCPCGKPLFPKKVIREDENFYYITQGAEIDCECAGDPNDTSKCECGKNLYTLAKKPAKSFDCFKAGGCLLEKNGEEGHSDQKQ